MQCIICYDISEDKLRGRLVKYLEKFACRIQYSVFIADLSAEHQKNVKSQIRKIIKGADHPMVVLAPICQNCFIKLWKIGDFLEEQPGCIIA